MMHKQYGKRCAIINSKFIIAVFPLIEDSMFYLLGIVMVVNTKQLHVNRSGIGVGEDMALFVYQK